jgi:copper chaperone CopZ
MLATFAVSDARRWLRQRTTTAPSATMTIGVEGMTCGGCVRKLEAALGKIDNLDFVAVQLEPGEVRASGQVDRDQILGAIRACGYRPVDADSTSERPAKA